MDGEQKAWAFFFACITIVLVTAIGSKTYYILEYDKMVERVIDKGVSPAVMRCVDMSWETIAASAICTKVLTRHSLTKEEAKKLMEELK